MDQLKPVMHGQMHWHARPEFHTLFFGTDGLRLKEWLDNGQAVIVKQGPHRIVYRVQVPELCFFVKHNRIPDTRSWLRYMFRGTKAWREAKSALEIARRGVATVEPLAVGEKNQGRGAGQSYLITRSLEHTVQFNDFLQRVLPTIPKEHQAALRIRLAEQLGTFIATLHNASIVHRDLHCGNLLLRLEPNHQPQFFLIDVQDVRLGGPLDWQSSQDNLTMFNRWLQLRTSRPDRRRFWKWYAQTRSPFPQDAQTTSQLALNLEKETSQSNQQFWLRRERRYLQSNKYIRRLNTATISGLRVADLDTVLVQQLLTNPDAPFHDAHAKILKDSPSSTVVELSQSRTNDVALIYKRFRVTETADSLTAYVRRAPALRSWLNGHSLRERGLPTARPLLVLHRYKWGRLAEGYLLMEKVENRGHLLEFLSQWDPATRQQQLRTHIQQLAQLIRVMHKRHLAHRDLKAPNILVLPESPTKHLPVGVNAPFVFIDLVGVSRHRHLSRRLRAKNLARLHASFHQDTRITRTDKLRFLRTYLQWGLLGRGGWKEWWKAIDRATQRKIEKNRRSGRMLS